MNTNHIQCPFCGFQNFAISAYCGRCERELPKEGSAVMHAVPKLPPTPTPVSHVSPSQPPTSGQNPNPTKHPSLQPSVEVSGVNQAATHTQSSTGATFYACGLGRSLGASLLDLLCVISVALLCAHTLAQASQLSVTNSISQSTLTYFLDFPHIPLTIFCLVGGCYAFVGSYLQGQSVGRWCTRTRLVSIHLEHIGAKHALLRSLVAILSGLGMGWGFLWAIVDRKNRSVHDIVCSTVLVLTSRP
jgi:uncharacterized RDD family membrane protein YckC